MLAALTDRRKKPRRDRQSSWKRADGQTSMKAMRCAMRTMTGHLGPSLGARRTIGL
jgi:hypothetical protein